MHLNMNAMRSTINNWGRIRQELINNIFVMLNQKVVYKFEDNKILKFRNGSVLVVHTAKKTLDDNVVEGIDTEGKSFEVPVDELETDSLIQLSDIICQQLEKLESENS